MAVPIPILLESMRMLLALPCCDARLSAAVLRATRHACGAAKGVQAIKGVVETFDHLVR